MSNLSALAAGTMGLDVVSGLFGLAAAGERSDALRDQARLARLEADAEAERYATQARAFSAGQRLKYLKAGVELTGSPLDVLDETARVAQENINAIRAKGASAAMELKGEAALTRAKGRSAMLEGFKSSALTYMTAAEKLGWGTKKK